MHVNDLQPGTFYAVHGRRARLDRLWRDSDGLLHADLSSGPGLTVKQTFRACLSRRGESIVPIQSDWESFTLLRERRRTEARRTDYLYSSFADKLTPLGLGVSVSSDQIVIDGDHKRFEKLLTLLDRSPSGLLEII